MGDSNPKNHIKNFIMNWKSKGMLKNRWVHAFTHMLGTIPRAWYDQEELHQKITYWDTVEVQFVSNVSFRGDEAQMTEAL